MVKEYDSGRVKRTKHMRTKRVKQKRTKHNKTKQKRTNKVKITKHNRTKINKTNKKRTRARSRVRRKRRISGGLTDDDLDTIDWNLNEAWHRKEQRNKWLAAAAGTGALAAAGIAVTAPIWGPPAAATLGTGAAVTGVLGTLGAAAPSTVVALKNQAQAMRHRTKAEQLRNKKTHAQTAIEEAAQAELSRSMKERYKKTLVQFQERDLKIQEDLKKKLLRNRRKRLGIGHHATKDECDAWEERRSKLGLEMDATDTECDAKEEYLSAMKGSADGPPKKGWFEKKAAKKEAEEAAAWAAERTELTRIVADREGSVEEQNDARERLKAMDQEGKMSGP
jgi:hypothetical protein